MLAITLLGNMPINLRVFGWDEKNGDPGDWRRLRQRWDRPHNARVLLDTAGSYSSPSRRYAHDAPRNALRSESTKRPAPPQPPYRPRTEPLLEWRDKLPGHAGDPTLSDSVSGLGRASGARPVRVSSHYAGLCGTKSRLLLSADRRALPVGGRLPGSA
jgi:hypothetical protein